MGGGTVLDNTRLVCRAGPTGMRRPAPWGGRRRCPPGARGARGRAPSVHMCGRRRPRLGCSLGADVEQVVLKVRRISVRSATCFGPKRPPLPPPPGAALVLCPQGSGPAGRSEIGGRRKPKRAADWVRSRHEVRPTPGGSCSSARCWVLLASVPGRRRRLRTGEASGVGESRRFPARVRALQPGSAPAPAAALPGLPGRVHVAPSNGRSLWPQSAHNGAGGRARAACAAGQRQRTGIGREGLGMTFQRKALLRSALPVALAAALAAGCGAATSPGSSTTTSSSTAGTATSGATGATSTAGTTGATSSAAPAASSGAATTGAASSS